MIKQVFHLSEELNEKLEKNIQSKPTQSMVESVIKFLKEQCKINAIESELSKINSISQEILSQYNQAIIVGIGGAMLSSV